MEQYELVVLYHPDLEIDLDKAEAKIKGLVKDAGGSIEGTDNWGKKKLAYKIASYEYAVYVFYALQMPTSGVKQLNNALNITDEVIRFLISRPDLKAIAKAEAMKISRDKRVALADENDDKKYLNDKKGEPK